MKITYDPDVDVMYIEFRSVGREGVETQEAAEGVHLDFGADGKLVGIELLDASSLSGADLQRVVLELRPTAKVPS